MPSRDSAAACRDVLADPGWPLPGGGQDASAPALDLSDATFLALEQKLKCLRDLKASNWLQPAWTMGQQAFQVTFEQQAVNHVQPS